MDLQKGILYTHQIFDYIRIYNSTVFDLYSFDIWYSRTFLSLYYMTTFQPNRLLNNEVISLFKVTRSDASCIRPFLQIQSYVRNLINSCLPQTIDQFRSIHTKSLKITIYVWHVYLLPCLL